MSGEWVYFLELSSGRAVLHLVLKENRYASKGCNSIKNGMTILIEVCSERKKFAP